MGRESRSTGEGNEEDLSISEHANVKQMSSLPRLLVLYNCSIPEARLIDPRYLDAGHFKDFPTFTERRWPYKKARS
jgi:hypothetical protein